MSRAGPKRGVLRFPIATEPQQMATSLYGRTSNFYVNGCQSDRSSNQPALRRQNGAVPILPGGAGQNRCDTRAGPYRYVGCKSFVAEWPRSGPAVVRASGEARPDGAVAMRRGDLGLLMEAPRPRSHDVREGAWWTNPARE